MKIKIWCPSEEDEADAGERDFDYEIDDPDFKWQLESEVEDLAEKRYDSGDPWDEKVFHVRLGDGSLKIFSVERQWDPTFLAVEKKPKP